MVGGIVLAGGRSSRMGAAKASLEWHGSTLLRRVAGLVERSVDGPVVIVRSSGQSLPSLPGAYEVVDDVREGRGPLEGLAAGLRALAGRADLAYVSSTDVPFLHTSFVGAVVGGIGAGDEICVPVIGRRRQPLAAAYRTSLTGVVDELLESGEQRVGAVFDVCRVDRLDREALLADAELARWDPELESVVNLNDPEAYAAARARPAPEIAVRWTDGLEFGSPGRGSTSGGEEISGGGGMPRGESTTGRGARTARAATVGALLDAIGVGHDGRIVVRVGGVGAVRDPEFPLERGDRVVIARGVG